MWQRRNRNSRLRTEKLMAKSQTRDFYAIFEILLVYQSTFGNVAMGNSPLCTLKQTADALI